MIVRGSYNYFASFFQDSTLSEVIRKKAGVPLLYISYNTIVLEAPSYKSQERADTMTVDKMSHEHKNLTLMRQSVLGEEPVVKKKKRKGPKGKNPLSCLKRKKRKNKQIPQSQSGEGGHKRKRKRKRHKAHDSGHEVV